MLLECGISSISFGFPGHIDSIYICFNATDREIFSICRC